MLDDCLEVFEAEMQLKKNMLLDAYIPKEGTYVLINTDDEFSVYDILDISVDKKSGEIKGQTQSNYRLITFLDYYSKLLEMNKAIDSTKIIHSNNYYSFYVKKDSIQQNKLQKKNIDSYYDVLRNPYKKYSKAKSRMAYQEVEKELGEVNYEEINRIQKWIEEEFEQFIINQNIDMSKKKYLKIFFIYEDIEKTKKCVEKEGMRYLMPNIFNSSDYNVDVDGVIYGLSGNNMNMNSKKPFLEMKSKRVGQQYLITKDKAMLQSQFFEYLGAQAAMGKYDIYIDLEDKKISAIRKGERIHNLNTGIYMRIQIEKNEVKIQNFDRIINFHQSLKDTFVLRNIYGDYIEKGDIKYGSKTQLYEIEGLVDDIFFGKKLIYNYWTEPSGISGSDSKLNEVLLEYRTVFWNWFHNSRVNEVNDKLDIIALKLIRNSINNDYSTKIVHQMNLWLSLKEYLDNSRRYTMEQSNARENLRIHIDEKQEWDFSNSDEYYYAVGQLMDLFSILNKSSKKTLSIINPILNAKSDQMIKKYIERNLKKYGYLIEKTDLRKMNLIGHVLYYKTEESINTSMIIAGFTMDNIFYVKKENGERNGEE